ncbi:hypothetical protein QUF74_10060 [Candidatus Halobeggiatoa sp. HSG11]|nr:hypothetical protein [Candidatus Halobeggiatoa sp. HSG11]
MNIDTQEAYLDTNTIVFAKSVIHALEDMIGTSFTLKKTSFREGVFASPFDMVAYIHFTGTVQGDYIFGLNEIFAAKLVEVYEEGMSKKDIRLIREEYSGFIKELLNTAVGLAIPALEQSFGELTYTPTTMVYGEMEFPEFKSGNILISSEQGEIMCGFSLNQAGVRIGKKLEQTLHELERMTKEVDKAHIAVKTILHLIHSTLVAVTPQGKILPGCGTATSIFGLSSDKDIIGLDLATFLELEIIDSRELEEFLQVFQTNTVISEEKISLIGKNEFINKQGKTFKLDWLPITNDSNQLLEKVLVIIEEVS